MYDLANSTTQNFGYDRSNQNFYSFNSLGYRSHNEFLKEKNSIIIIGNSISFGIGIPYEKTFGYILEKNLNRVVYNFSVGCFLHTNHWQLDRCCEIINEFKPSLLIFQINNLDKVFIDNKVVISSDQKLILNLFDNFYKKLMVTLERQNYLLIYWDNLSYQIPKDVKENICIYNKFHIDSAIDNKSIFGINSHKLIAYKLINMIK